MATKNAIQDFYRPAKKGGARERDGGILATGFKVHRTTRSSVGKRSYSTSASHSDLPVLGLVGVHQLNEFERTWADAAKRETRVMHQRCGIACFPTKYLQLMLADA